MASSASIQSAGTQSASTHSPGNKLQGDQPNSNHLHYKNVAFLSDYGLASHKPALVRSQIETLAPGVEITDLTHGIEPFNKREGAYVLCESAKDLKPGIVLALVDAHITQSNRALAVAVGNGESVLLGPDNGLLAPVVALAGGASHAVVLHDTRSAVIPGTNGASLFASAVARLCLTGSLDGIGDEIPLDELVPGVMTFGVLEGSVLKSSVLYIDTFGNVVLDSEASLIDASSLIVECGERRATSLAISTVESSAAESTTAKSFMGLDATATQATHGEKSRLLHFANHLGFIELRANSASAASLLGCSVGDEVELRKQLL